MRGFFMTKPVKIIVSVVGGGLLLVVVALVATLIMIDSVAKTGIEKGGSYALGVPTALDSASIGIASGKFGLSGLAVDNPQGFEGKFLKLGDGGVEVSLGSLMKDTVVLPRLALSDVELDLKRTSSGSNYGIILDNLKKLESGEKAKPKEEKPGKTFKISEVVIRPRKGSARIRIATVQSRISTGVRQRPSSKGRAALEVVVIRKSRRRSM